MTTRSRQPWRKKNRWGAAVAVWLVAVYVLSTFPAGYSHGRGWLGIAAVQAVYWPLIKPLDGTPPGEAAEYLFEWGDDLGRAASD